MPTPPPPSPSPPAPPTARTPCAASSTRSPRGINRSPHSLANLPRRLQYIAELEARLGQAPHDPAPPFTWPRPYFLQVFWKTAASDYTEAASRRVLFPAHGGAQTCYFDLPPEAIGPLRIDPGDEPGLWSILEISLHAIDEQGTLVTPPLLDCSPETQFRGLAPGPGVFFLNAHTATGPRDLLAQTNDPGFLLLTPPRTDSRPWALRVHCRANDMLHWFVQNHANQLAAALADAHRTIACLTGNPRQTAPASPAPPSRRGWLARLLRG